MSNEKATIILLFFGLIKNIALYKMTFFREPYNHRKNKIKVKLDLSNYVIKSNSKNSICFDTLNFAKMSDLSSLKSEINKLDIAKSNTTPIELSKLSDVVRNEVVKKTTYDELA